MTRTAARARNTTQRRPRARATLDAPTSGQGLYLYGVTRWSRRADLDLPRVLSGVNGRHLRAVHIGQLLAIVEPVAIAEFSAEALRAHLDDAAWLPAMASQHHATVVAIHRLRTILPVKFGCVFARREDLIAGLTRVQDVLLARLAQVEGCDEVGIHIYADTAVLRTRLEAEHPTLSQLAREFATATPGRAYLLRRKFARERVVVCERAMAELATAAHADLSAHAIAAEVSARGKSVPVSDSEIEILRASFLVSRPVIEAFFTACRAIGERTAGVRCEHTDPWPPYSFAQVAQESEP